MILTKAKKRPCIFFTCSGITRQERHLLTNDFYFLPMYSASKFQSPSKSLPPLLERIKWCEYSHLIYLPSHPIKKIKLENTIPSRESIIRLDRAFYAAPMVPTVTPTDLKIHEDFFEIIKEHFVEYFLGIPGEILDVIRKEVSTTKDSS